MPFSRKHQLKEGTFWKSKIILCRKVSVFYKILNKLGVFIDKTALERKVKDEGIKLGTFLKHLRNWKKFSILSCTIVCINWV